MLMKWAISYQTTASVHFFLDHMRLFLPHTRHICPMKNAADFFQTPPADSPAPPPIHDEVEACAAVLVACLHANELYGMTENTAFHAAIQHRNIFKGRDPQTLMADAEVRYEQAGSPATLIDTAIGAIREQTRLPLFYQCLDLILSDGLVTPRENEIIRYLKTRFAVPAAAVELGLEVLLVKNRL